jgi:hypothetical protein
VLNWSDTAAETSYTVERSTDGINFDLLATLGADVTTYIDTPVSFDTAYTYRVNSVNGSGSTPSNLVTVTTPPLAPTDLTAAYQDRLQVVLNWTDASAHEDGFVIERIEGDITTLVTTVGPDVQTYADTTIAFDGAYSYQVYAFNASGPSDLSNLATADAPPLAPTGLTASYDSGVLLTWFDQSLAETGFSVQRCDIAVCTDADFTEIGTPGPLTTGNEVGNVTYLDENVTPLGMYSYRVFAVNASGLSDASNIVSITLPDFPAPPVPGSIARAGTNGSNARKITVTWTAVLTASGYTIQWATDSAFTTQVGTGSASQSATSFTTPNNALTRGTTYYFRIRAESANGSSLWAYYQAYTLP